MRIDDDERVFFKEVPNASGSGTHIEDVTERQVRDAITIEGRVKYLNELIKEAEEEKAALIKKCKHIVRFEEPGHDYYVRHCVGCGNIEFI